MTERKQINLNINKLTSTQYDSIANPVETDLYFITDDVGLISQDVIDALGYTPYNSTNPNGYTNNKGTVTSVNNVQPINGNVTIAIPDTATWGNITGNLADQTDLQQVLDGKQSTITGASTTIIDNDLTAGRALISDNSGKVATSSITTSKLGYLSDVTSNIQVQINEKYDASNPAGYISGITNSDVTTALGYTPYNASNPEEYISSASISSLTDVNLTNVANNQALLYNFTTQTWENKDVTITVDAGLSTTSENPVQNKVITNALEDKQDFLTPGTDLEIVSVSGDAQTVSGTNSVTFNDAEQLNSVMLYGACEQSETPTPDNPVDIVCNNGVIGWDSVNQEIIVTGNTETVTDSLGITATAEMLLGMGEYSDIQDVLSGEIERKINLMVFDGTESWMRSPTGSTVRFSLGLTESAVPTAVTRGNILSTHFKNIGNVITQDVGGAFISQQRTLFLIPEQTITTVQELKNWLAQQYSNGTPVMVMYPLADARSEAVGTQTLNVTNDTNIIRITQAGIANLSISVTYSSESSTVINFTNNSGYTKNIGTVTSVNNVLPDSNGNVTIQTGGTVDQTYSPTSQNAQSGVAINGAKFIQNLGNDGNLIVVNSQLYNLIIGTANLNNDSYGVIAIGNTEQNGIGSVAIGGDFQGDPIYAGDYSIVIGMGAGTSGTGSIAIGGVDPNTEGTTFVTNDHCIAIGSDTHVNEYADNSIAMGYNAYVDGESEYRETGNNIENAIQLGTGSNETSNTFQVFDYTLLNTSTGLIPDGRISTNIARTIALNNKTDTDLANVTDTGTSTGAGWAMPSNSYVNLTLGASGTAYTAPANGYYYWRGNVSNNGYPFAMYIDENGSDGFGVMLRSPDTSQVACYLPVKKNDVMKVQYNGVKSTAYFRFYYAQGSESEAN